MLSQMKDLGYESHNAVANLGSIFVFAVLYCFQIILYWLLRLFGFKKLAKIQNYLKEKLFYSVILQLILDAYLEFLISGMLNMQ